MLQGELSVWEQTILYQPRVANDPFLLRSLRVFTSTIRILEGGQHEPRGQLCETAHGPVGYIWTSKDRMTAKKLGEMLIMCPTATCLCWHQKESIKSDQTAIWSQFPACTILFLRGLELLAALIRCTSTHSSLPAAAPTAALIEMSALFRDLETILRPEVAARQIKAVLHTWC